MARHARKARRNARNRNMAIPLLVAVVLILFLYAFIVTANYLKFTYLLTIPTIINPPLKFVVNVSNANVSQMSQVSLNESFCPESDAIQKYAASLNSYIYYTNATPGEEFNYALVYNASNYTFAYAVVLPPFKLNSFQNVILNRSTCAGYPDDFGHAELNISAPTASYYGPIYVVLYFYKK